MGSLIIIIFYLTFLFGIFFKLDPMAEFTSLLMEQSTTTWYYKTLGCLGLWKFHVCSEFPYLIKILYLILILWNMKNLLLLPTLIWQLTINYVCPKL